MDLLRQEKLRERYLVALWESHAGNYGGDRQNREVCEKAGIDYDDEALIICQYLQRKGYISWTSFESVHLEPQGIFEAEKLVKSTYQKKANQVLQQIYRMSGHAHIDWVDALLVAEKLNMSLEEISVILNDLHEQKGLVARQGDNFQLTGAGIETIESGPRNASSISYTLNVHGDNYGGVQQGDGNTQNIVVNQPISEILPKLAELIAAVRAQDFGDKDEVVADLEKVKALALGDVNDGVWKRIQTRLTAAKTTMEITGLAYKSLPYWPLIWHYFMG